MLATVAIDDEPIALDVIKNLAEKVPFLLMRGFFTNAFEAMDFLRNEKIDLIFLDIKMPDISGIDFLQSLLNPPMVIFTTAYSEHAVQSFELDAIDYLLKPFSLSRLLKACNKAHKQWELRHNNSNDVAPATIFIKNGYGKERLELDDLLYVESSGNYVQFVGSHKKIISRITITEAEALLPATAFLRIHRSYIVARRKVTRIDKNCIWIKETALPLGAGYMKEVEKLTK